MENKDSLVSIIVPVYGTEAYLPACIESILAQSYSNIQLILVDDQSPDKCPEICDDYAQIDERIMVIHQKNKGVSGARNTGIRHAEGEYIMFVDSDDELIPDAVAVLLRDAQEYNADVVSGTLALVNSNGAVVSKDENGNITVFSGYQPLLLSLKGDSQTESACAKLFKTDFIRDVYFEEGKNIHEDGFFIFQCYAKNPILIHRNIALYRYNNREGSASRQFFSDKYLSMLYFLKKKKEFLIKKYPQYTDCVYNMEVRTHLQLLDVLCRTNDSKYKEVQKQCVKTVCRLHKYHMPINDHHKMLACLVVYRLYPLYKFAVRMKYYK